MQSKSYFVSILIAIIFLSSYTVTAQIVGPNCFLKGLYVEVGINTCGAFGSSVAPPAGYHPTEGGLGFVADWESDGWATGTPIYCGDYFVPELLLKAGKFKLVPTFGPILIKAVHLLIYQEM